jgi:hypothetical protein
MVAWVLADAVIERFGADRLDAMLAAWAAVRGADLPGAAAERGLGAPAPGQPEGSPRGKGPV